MWNKPYLTWKAGCIYLRRAFFFKGILYTCILFCNGVQRTSERSEWPLRIPPAPPPPKENWPISQLLAVIENKIRSELGMTIGYAAAATAAKSLQSCPTLCDPTEGSPPGSPIPGILQARTLEWDDWVCLEINPWRNAPVGGTSRRHHFAD